MIAKEKISIVVPAYNEADNIVDRVNKIKDTMESNNKNYEVIVIDDGSTDATGIKVREEFSNNHSVRYSRHEPNMGKGYAIRKGFTLSKGELVGFIDADRDLHPSHLLEFERILNLNNADAVIGSKRHLDSIMYYPPIRRLYSNAYYHIVKLIFRLPIGDTQTGIKLFKRKAIETVYSKLRVNRFAFDLELLVLLKRAGFNIAEAPVKIDFSRGKSNRISFRDVWFVFKDTLSTFTRIVVLHEDKK
jgi:glycosyltransferase involved in cell wall biosynthesis